MAVKLSQKKGVSEDLLAVLRLEESVVKQLQRSPHKNVMECKVTFESKGHFCTVSQFADGGENHLLWAQYVKPRKKF